jgi:uncharacterized protein (DUF1778 family)
MTEAMQPVSVRLTAEERDLVRAAAEQARTNISDFMRRRVVAAAESELAEQSVITIAAEDWERFESWRDAPAKEIPALRKLAQARSEWTK